MHFVAAALLCTVNINMDTINKWAILDSGATSNFLTTGAPITNIQLANKSIIAHLPNGDQVQSTPTCTLDLPKLSAVACLAHIIPGLASHSLVSVLTLGPRLAVALHIVAAQFCAAANACALDCG
jgi:hypothetical protein